MPEDIENLKSQILSLNCFETIKLRSSSSYENAQLFNILSKEYHSEENLSYCKKSAFKSLEIINISFKEEILNQSEQQHLSNLIIENFDVISKCSENYVKSFENLKNELVYEHAKSNITKYIEVLNENFKKEDKNYFFSEMIKKSLKPIHIEIFSSKLLKFCNLSDLNNIEIEKLQSLKPLLVPFLGKKNNVIIDTKKTMLTLHVTEENLFEAYNYSLLSNNKKVFQKILSDIFLMTDVLTEKENKLIEIYKILDAKNNFKFDKILDFDSQNQIFDFLKKTKREDLIFKNLSYFKEVEIPLKIDVLLNLGENELAIELYKSHLDVKYKTKTLVSLLSLLKMDTALINKLEEITSYKMFLICIERIFKSGNNEILSECFDIFSKKFFKLNFGAIKKILLIVSCNSLDIGRIQRLKILKNLLQKIEISTLKNNKWVFKFIYNCISESIDIFSEGFIPQKEVENIKNFNSTISGFIDLLEKTEILDENYILCLLCAYNCQKNMKIFVCSERISKLYDISTAIFNKRKNKKNDQILILFLSFFLSQNLSEKVNQIFKKIKITKINHIQLLEVDQNYCHSNIKIIALLIKKSEEFNTLTPKILNKKIINLMNFGPQTVVSFLNIVEKELNSLRNYFDGDTEDIINKLVEIAVCMDNEYLRDQLKKYL